MLKIFELIGRYFILMGKVFSRPEKRAIYRRRIIYEMESLGLNSIGLTAIISVFIGAVITLQMSINLESPFIPKYIIGYATRETMILEFSSTVVALILAGKVGSSIASEIGTMRITEQIDALEIMGVNSASYLILPKIVATVLFFPFLAILSILIGIAGGYLISALTGIMIPDDYVQGLLYDFRPYSITYTLIKMAVFAFIITSISAFYGYYAKGNSLEVGAASTQGGRGQLDRHHDLQPDSHPNPAYMIKADHISKSFDGRVVLDDVSVEFDTGTTNLVIGKSGSGKTVLLQMSGGPARSRFRQYLVRRHRLHGPRIQGAKGDPPAISACSSRAVRCSTPRPSRRTSSFRSTSSPSRAKRRRWNGSISASSACGSTEPITSTPQNCRAV